MKVIVPCCGRSSRYPNQAPKYLLPSHDGRPMISLAIAGLDVSLDDVVVAVLREHEEKFSVREGFARAFGRPVEVVIHDEPTKSQSETVARTLRKLGLSEPFLIKDSDNAFVLSELKSDTNYVSVESLNHFDSINPRNKSYVQVDHHGVITNIREKLVISDLFSVGGYYFTTPDQFLHYYDKLSKNTTEWTRELYISDLIGAMILDGIPFRSREVTRYEDWGTLHEWRRALLARRAYIVMIDGFVFERGSPHFSPRFEEVRPNPAAIEALIELHKQGHSMLYLSIRDSALADVTARQLAAAGAPPGPVLFGAPVAGLTLVSAPHATLPFATVEAIELSAQAPADGLLERLRGQR